MKLSNTTLLAILASTAFVSAAPVDVPIGSELMVKRSDANEVIELLNELQALKVKRDYIENSDDLLELQRREDNAIGNLISALINSGLITDIFKKITSDPEISAVVRKIIQSAIETATVEGPALIKAIWNSGLLSDIISKFLNDTDLRGALLGVVKSLFGTAVNLLKSWLASRTGGSDASSGSDKRDFIAPRAVVPSGDVNLDEYLDKRGVADLVVTAVQAIYKSGLIQLFVQKILANPEQSINFLTSAFKSGLAVAEDVYGWAKKSGLWDKAIAYMGAHAGDWAKRLADIIGPLLSGGKIQASEIDNATTGDSTKAGTSTSSTSSASSAIEYVESLDSSSKQKRHLY